MSKEIDIAALRKAAEEIIAFAGSRPGWEKEYDVPGIQTSVTRRRARVHVEAPQLVALLDRLEQAEREAELYRHVSGLTKASGYGSVTEALVALDKAEKDAARYRWLRDKANGGGEGDPMVCLYPPDGTYLVDGDELDAAVDKAMQGEGE